MKPLSVTDPAKYLDRINGAEFYVGLVKPLGENCGYELIESSPRSQKVQIDGEVNQYRFYLESAMCSHDFLPAIFSDKECADLLFIPVRDDALRSDAGKTNGNVATLYFRFKHMPKLSELINGVVK